MTLLLNKKPFPKMSFQQIIIIYLSVYSWPANITNEPRIYLTTNTALSAM